MTSSWGTDAAGAVPGAWRILVTGSRDWPDPERIRDGLAEAAAMRPDGTAVTLIHGQCDPRHPRTGRPVRWQAAMCLPPGDQMELSGADWLADCWARRWDWEIERVPADWENLGKAAGFIRNAGMVARGADVCPAFIKDRSSGATGCARRAREAGIMVIPHTITTALGSAL